ncbi:MAG: bifunctional alpha,alpha-trehalose-phosphate synthase (UDP-forming)/trehalose-phosphatase [Myxococcales bacterium]|nr:bifunctional alpha,alpha-trehalose-phosphate synthase (UDP-forming)/trehalose-phosphatase [Myxococcales bacterium]
MVSNRLPVTLQRGPRGLESKRSVGGLVSALDPLLRRRGGSWVGWPGTRLRDDETLDETGSEYGLHAVALTDTEVNRYYHGFSNRTLWPLFHSLPERARFDRRDWEAYERVNARFAEASTQRLDPSRPEHNLVWVHDYQLMRTPTGIRKLCPEARIAFFLHIPFPPPDLFRLLPWDRELLQGLLGADLIGFHVAGYARNFLECVDRLLGARVDHEASLIEFGSRTIRVGAFPLGIDFARYQSLAEQAAPATRAGRERIILGVDRLDYTKGIPNRLRAFERLLELHPEYREQVILLQIAVPSRSQVAEYQALKREIDEIVGHVNGRFATASWSPIRYLYRSFPQERLAALYRDADVTAVTPLRDGMNLIAKEFVACQVDDPGVLVLSQLAGAAERMPEALLVNPHDLDGSAEALHRALSMDEPERRSRMLALRRRERRFDLDAWGDHFLEAARTPEAPLGLVRPEEFEAWLGAFVEGHPLALFLDFDGTLAAIAQRPEEAAMTAGMRSAIETCAKRADTEVTIVSGRGIDDLEAAVGIPGLTYAGNHGFEIRGPELEDFRHAELAGFAAGARELIPKLEALAPDGAWIEAKGPTLTFHFREVEPALHAELARNARSEVEAAGFRARDGKYAVEARPPIAWDKGSALLYILRHRYGEAWSESVRAIYVGDDQTDEDAFRMLAGLGFTFRVGEFSGLTEARRLLRDPEAVEQLLSWLARRPASSP